MKNQFLTAVNKYNAYTEKGAISHATSGSGLLDYFSKSATYRERELSKTFADMGKIWAESPIIALQIIFYNRLISRKITGSLTTKKVQNGQGNRSEFRNAITWLARYHKETLAKNLWLIPMVGTWKDLWHTDLINEIDRTATYQLIEDGLANDNQRALIAKYLPRIRSKSNTYNTRHKELNQFAFGLLKKLNWTPKYYRKFKASGQAHDFQRKMCKNQWDQLKFNEIPGKALFQFVNKVGKDDQSTFQRHGIEQNYVDWILTQPTAKFTGYVYELMNAVTPKMSLAQKLTLDKQFDGLIQLAKQDQKISENVWCALDTSESMKAKVANTSAFDICISLGVYFSTLNEGAFKDQVIMFDQMSRTMKLQGSFSDKVLQIQSKTIAWGSTNFQSVIDEVVRVRQSNPSIPVSDYPSTLVVVSDMQFDPTEDLQTNYEKAMSKLRAVGLPKIRIVWWWVTGRGQDFPNQIDDEGVIMIGGFDGSILSTLIGEEPKQTTASESVKTDLTINPFEAMLKALDQEILFQLKIDN